MNTKKLSLFLIILMAVGLVGLTAAAEVDNLTVDTLGTKTPDTESSYTISFGINQSLAIGSGEIVVEFPTDTSVPSSYDSGDITIKEGTESAKDVESGDVSVSSQTVTITLGQALSAGETITVEFTSSAGIVNPASAGYYELKVDTNKENTQASSDPYAVYGAPTISSISPTTGDQGKSGLEVTITGTNLIEMTGVTFGTGSDITVDSYTNKSQDDMSTSGDATTMKATIDIAAPTGSTAEAKDVTVTNSAGSDTLAGGFTIEEPPAPSLTGVLGTSYQGANDTVKLTFDNPVAGSSSGELLVSGDLEISNGGDSLTLTNATFEKLNDTNSDGFSDEWLVTLDYADDGAYLDKTTDVSVTPAADAIVDGASQAVPTDTVSGTVGGDSVNPTATLSYETTPPVNGDEDSWTITADFSEKMQDAPTISIDNGVLESTQDMSGSGTSWTYDLNVPSDVNSTVEVTITGTDLAGNDLASVSNKTFEIDNTAPTIDSVTGTTVQDGGDTIEVTFSEDVEPASGSSWSDLIENVESPIGDALDLTNAEFSYDSKDLTITLNEATDGAYLTYGDNELEVNTYASHVKDAAGNLNSAQELTDEDVGGDDTAPVVSSVKGNSDTQEITVTFSEAVVPDDGSWSANEFDSVVNPLDNPVNINNATFVPNDNPGTGMATELVVELNESVDDSVLVAGMDSLEVSMQNVSDLPGNVISSGTVTGNVLTDSEAVKVYEGESGDKKASYGTVQAAVNNAAAGDSIVVTDKYTEDFGVITVDKKLTLEPAANADPTIVNRVDVEAADVTVDGLTFKYDSDNNNYYGLLVKADGVTVTASTFNGSDSEFDGIRLSGGAKDITINSENTFKNIKKGKGIVSYGATATVENNIFQDVEFGILVGQTNDSSENWTIKDNEFKAEITEAALVFNNAMGDVMGEMNLGDMTVTDNAFNDVDSIGVALSDQGSTSFSSNLDATGNWWGSVTGPSGTGPGSGASVGEEVDGSTIEYDPWLNPDGEPIHKQGQELTTVEGWQMASLSVKADSPKAEDVFSGYTGAVFSYDPDTGDYDSLSEIADEDVSPKDGLWVYDNSGGNVAIDIDSGDAREVNYGVEYTLEPIDGEDTWYMFGVPFDAFWGDVKFSSGSYEDVSPSDAQEYKLIRNMIYTYNTDYDSTVEDPEPYLVAASGDAGLLEADVGYWIRVDAPVTMTVPFTAGGTPLEVSSASTAQTLEKAPAGADMPPAPPVVKSANADLKVTAAVTESGVTFEVAGADVQSIDVQVFSTEGTEIFSGSAAGSSLSWDANVSNGVYLYGMTAKVGGEVKPLGIQKLLILE